MKQIDLVRHDNERAAVIGQRVAQSSNVPVQKFRLAQIQISIQHKHDAMRGSHALPGCLKHHLAQMPAHLITGMVQTGRRTDTAAR